MVQKSITRRACAIAGTASLVLGVAACGSGAGASQSADGTKSYTIAASLAVMGVPFDVSLEKGIKDEAARIAEENGVDIEVVTLDAKSDSQRQASQIQTMIAQQVDGIIFYPVAPGSAKSMVDAADRANIPLGALHGYIGTDPEQVNENLAFQVNIQNVNGSKATADEIVKALPQGGDIAMVLGAPGFQDNDLAQQGFLPVFENTPGFSVVSVVPGDWTKEGGQSACANIFTAHPNTKAVYALSDDMAVGCAAAAKSAGIAPLILGNGGQQGGIAGIEAGDLYATQCQKPIDEGQIAMQKIWDAINGKAEEPPTLTAMPVTIVGKDTVGQCTPQY